MREDAVNWDYFTLRFIVLIVNDYAHLKILIWPFADILYLLSIKCHNFLTLYIPKSNSILNAVYIHL